MRPICQVAKYGDVFTILFKTRLISTLSFRNTIKLRRIALLRSSSTREACMAGQRRTKRTKVRGHLPKAQFRRDWLKASRRRSGSGASTILDTIKTKYVVPQARRKLTTRQSSSAIFFRPAPIRVAHCRDALGAVLATGCNIGCQHGPLPGRNPARSSSLYRCEPARAGNNFHPKLRSRLPLV